MIQTTTNLRISSIEERLATPRQIIDSLPADSEILSFVQRSREVIEAILEGNDSRLLVIVGPCSIHDPETALQYAEKLAAFNAKSNNGIFVIMRVYFEKPRTTVGWKGLINDPDLDETYKIEKGLRSARSLLLDFNKMGLPCGTEYLDLITPQYFNDLIAWGAIGARTTESQCHRQLASGLSCPVGFKNGTDGNIKIAIQAMLSARGSHAFLGVTHEGRLASFKTTGNKSTHIILRGGINPNYDSSSIEGACQQLKEKNLQPRVMVDCSHANSNKDYRLQPKVASDIAGQLASGNIFGVMIESNIYEGNQKLGDPASLKPGVSITDGCISWETTEAVLAELNHAAQKT